MPQNNTDSLFTLLKHIAPSFLISTRFLLAFVLFLGNIVQYSQRVNMSMAIVCMIDHPEKRVTNVTFNENVTNETTSMPASLLPIKEGKFDWSRTTQGLILSAYFYGYILTQILSGWLSMKYGPKIVLTIGVLGGSLFTLLTPLAAGLSPYLVIFVRFLIGFFHVN
jgi:MFS family permease